jgi:dTDP-4-dehydrorhamnose reductase
MKILLIGSRGQLGWELERVLSTLGELHAADFPELDLADSSQVRDFVRSYRPSLIINAAAYTAVDKAESESQVSMAVNGTAPGVLAEVAETIQAGLIHYSTDYVFDGTKGSPYTEDDAPNPINVYGRTKWAGDQAVAAVDGSYIILRTSWVYGFRRPSFASNVIQWSRTQKIMQIVTDQIGSPTWCRILAEMTGQMIAIGRADIYHWLHEHRGLFHLAGDGAVSRYDFSKAALRYDPQKEFQVVREILPALTAEFPTPAVRPMFSALNCDRFTAAFGLRLPDWETALRLALTK